jgi:hypothetical protein
MRVAPFVQLDKQFTDDSRLAYLKCLNKRSHVIKIRRHYLDTTRVESLCLLTVDISGDGPHSVCSIFQEGIDNATALATCCSDDNCDWLRHCVGIKVGIRIMSKYTEEEGGFDL